MPPVADTTKPVRFKDFQPHESGSSSITKIRIEAPFSIFPLKEEIKNLNFEKSARQRMEVYVDGSISSGIYLNENLTIGPI